MKALPPLSIMLLLCLWFSAVQSQPMPPMCINGESYAVKCPPDDDRPAVSGEVAKRNFLDVMRKTLRHKHVTDLRNGWFTVESTPSWREGLQSDGSGYCSVEAVEYKYDFGSDALDADRLYYHARATEKECTGHGRRADAVTPMASRGKYVRCDSDDAAACIGAREFFERMTKREILDDPNITIDGLKTKDSPRAYDLLKALDVAVSVSMRSTVLIDRDRYFPNTAFSSCMRMDPGGMACFDARQRVTLYLDGPPPVQ